MISFAPAPTFMIRWPPPTRRCHPERRAVASSGDPLSYFDWRAKRWVDVLSFKARLAFYRFCFPKLLQPANPTSFPGSGQRKMSLEQGDPNALGLVSDARQRGTYLSSTMKASVRY